MKRLFKTLPYALFALLLFVGSGIVTQAHARGARPSIKTCKACRGIANELEDALHRRNQLRDILRNWENRYKGLTGQLGSIRELEAKLSKSKSRSLSDDIRARIKAVKTAKAKVAKFRKMVQDANANANRWQARFDACHKKHCKGERQGGRAIGMGGYLPLGLRRVHTTCLPCKPIAKKLNKKYRKIYNAERQLARLQLRLESLMSRYGTTADLKHNMTKLWSRYTAASGADRGRLHKRWQAKMDQLNEIAGAKEEIGVLKDSIKDYEAEAKVLNRKLWKCVKEECGDKPDHRVGMLNGWGKTCDGQ